MADNLAIKDATGASKTIRATDRTSIWVPHHILDNPYSAYRTLTAGNTGLVAKASAGKLHGWALANLATTYDIFVKLYDKATAPTSGDTPKLTLLIPAGEQIPAWSDANGITFTAGISVRATTGSADNDTGDASGDAIVNLFYV